MPAEDAGLVDLIAFHSTEPSRIYRRTGIADYLGRHRLVAALFLNEPLRIFRTPLQWLRALGDGICPLTADVERLRGLPALLFELGEGAFAASIRRRMARPEWFPAMKVAS